MSSGHAHHKLTQPALSLLALMMAIGPFGDTLYTPAMPAITHALHADYGLVQLTMASYLFGSAGSRLFYGPLSDRFGRRPIMLMGTAILTMGGIICLLSFAIWPLIAGRLVQGMGACAGAVIAEAMVRDAFAADRRQNIYARLNAAFALAPAAGPIAGIYLTEWLGWHANFGLLVLLSVALLMLVWRYLPETHPDLNRSVLKPGHLRHNLWDVLTTRGFVFYAALSGLCIGVVYTALIGAPDLVLNVLDRGNLGIMIVSLAILTAFVMGALLGAVLSSKVPPNLFIGAGLAVVLGGSIWLLIVALMVGKQGTLVVYLIPIGVAFIGVGMTVPIATARAMAPFDKNTGMASSLLGSIQMGVAGFGTLGMGLLHQGAVKDIPLVFLTLSGLAVLVFRLTWRGLSTASAACVAPSPSRGGLGWGWFSVTPQKHLSERFRNVRGNHPLPASPSREGSQLWHLPKAAKSSA